MLLDMEKISSLSYDKNKEHCIIFFEKKYEITENGKLFSKTHSITIIGDELKSVPQVLKVYDGSQFVLQKYEARIIHTDGKSSKFSKRDLGTFALSNRYKISESKKKIVTISDNLSSGDIIEQVSVHEITLPQLGIEFSLEWLDNIAYNITCSFEIPASEELNYLVVNDTIIPEIESLDSKKIYRFNWKNYKKPAYKGVFSNWNYRPAIYAASPQYYKKNKNSLQAKDTWQAFGDWYWDIIQLKLISTSSIDSTAKAITAGISNPKDKMDAIFRYCQKNVRYEAV